MGVAWGGGYRIPDNVYTNLVMSAASYDWKEIKYTDNIQLEGHIAWEHPAWQSQT